MLESITPVAQCLICWGRCIICPPKAVAPCLARGGGWYYSQAFCFPPTEGPPASPGHAYHLLLLIPLRVPSPAFDLVSLNPLCAGWLIPLFFLSHAITRMSERYTISSDKAAEIKDILLGVHGQGYSSLHHKSYFLEIKENWGHFLLLWQ